MASLGYTLMLKGEDKAAIDLFHQAIEVDPKYAPAHYNLAFALSNIKETNVAAREYAKAHELDPSLTAPKELKVKPKSRSLSITP
jgi:Tfp pilus assembly protein PilF